MPQLQQRGCPCLRVCRARADWGAMTVPTRFVIDRERGCRRPVSHEHHAVDAPEIRHRGWVPRPWIIPRVAERSCETRALDEPAGTLTCRRECTGTGSRRELHGGSEAHQGQFLSSPRRQQTRGRRSSVIRACHAKNREPSPVYRNSAKAVGQFRPIEACKHPRTLRCR